MDDTLEDRIARLSPAKRALFELRLKEQTRDHSAQQTIPRLNRNGCVPLSFGQQRLWFLYQLEPTSAAYNESRAIRLTGILNVDALRWALNQIVERHEVLRTTFESINGTPIQRITGHRDISLSFVDLTTADRTDGNTELQRLLRETAQRPFDLSRDLMLRALLVRLDDHEHILCLVTHHIASDGWSAGILARELGAFYESSVSQRPCSLPELPIQYSDYASWQRDWLAGERGDNQIAYWKRQLSGVPPLMIATDLPRPPVQTHAGGKTYCMLSEALTGDLKSLGRREGATLFMTLMAAFQALLMRY